MMSNDTGDQNNTSVINPGAIGNSIVDFMIDFFKNPLIRWWLSVAFAGLFVVGIILTVYFGAVLKTQGAMYITGWVFAVSGFLLLMYQLMLNKIPAEFVIKQEIFSQLTDLQKTNTDLQKTNAQLKERNDELNRVVVKAQTNNAELKTQTLQLGQLTDQQNKANKSMKLQLGMMTELLNRTASQNLSLEEIQKSLGSSSQTCVELVEKNEALGTQLNEVLKKLNNTLNQVQQMKLVQGIDDEQDEMNSPRNRAIKIIDETLKKLDPANNSVTSQDITLQLTVDEAKAISLACKGIDELSDVLEEKVHP
ncbi:MAG: hypothetical protein ACON5A_01105 [Candidatus Comchoanobacterales bacterium]